MTKIKKAVFPVGGLGTRFLPVTKSIPKEMLTIVDQPLIQYAVNEAKEAGIEQFIFVTGRGKASLEDYFDKSFELTAILQDRKKYKVLEELEKALPQPGSIIYTRQQEPNGLGHAVYCAKEWVGNEPFAVLLADDFIHGYKKGCLKQMVDAWETTGGNMLATEEVDIKEISKYGVLDIMSEDNRTFHAKGIVEKPKQEDAPSTHAVIGRYILQPEIFNILSDQQAGVGGEIQLTDAISKSLSNIDLYGYSFEGQRFDCGSKIGFLEANIAEALKRNDMHDDILKVLKSY